MASGIDSVRQSPVVLGEVLFDHFRDGSRVLGGAPFNVAWHLQGFGLRPRFVSRVGDDDEGRRVREAAGAWGISARSLQTDPERSTGRVDVRVDGEDVDFTIPPDQAFDRIETPSEEEIPPGDWILYRGTLAVRGTSRGRFAELCERGGGVFLDVNLRDPWWEIDRTLGLIDAARWVKMNEDEFRRLGDGSDPEAFRRARGLEGLIVTRGADGAAWYGPSGTVYEAASSPVRDLVDPVGAGDAFSAVCLAGLIAGWEVPLVLERAVAFAADVCRRRGATATDPELYDRPWRLRSED